jgi:hypothetical protein
VGLFLPQPFGLQIVCFVAAFFGGPGLAWLVGQAMGGLSESAQAGLCIPFVLVFFIGDSLWMARLPALSRGVRNRGVSAEP